MSRSLRSLALHGSLVATLLTLAACGGKQEAPATDAAPAAAASTEAAPATTGSSAAVAPATSVAPASTTASIEPAAIPAPADAPLSVAKLTLGNAVDAEHQISHASDSFASNTKAIYAAVATEGKSEGATLNAKWSYLEGKGQLVSSISQSIATDGPATTTFQVQNPDLWPEGKYRVEISLDGKTAATQDFQIKKS